MRAIAIALLGVVFGILILLKLLSRAVDMDRLYDEDFDDEDIDEFGDDA